MAAKKNTKRLQATAYHEAGHAVVRLHLEAEQSPVFLDEIIEALDKDGVFLTATKNLDELVEAKRKHMLGPAVEKVTIVPGEDYSGLCEGKSLLLDSLDSLDDATRCNLERMAMVHLAGPAAQKRFNPKGFRKVHAESDYKQLTDILMLLARRDYDEETQVYCRLLEIWTDVLIQCLWGEITAVAEALLKHQTLTCEEVERIIKATVAGKLGGKNK